MSLQHPDLIAALIPNASCILHACNKSVKTPVLPSDVVSTQNAKSTITDPIVSAKGVMKEIHKGFVKNVSTILLLCCVSGKRDSSMFQLVAKVTMNAWMMRLASVGSVRKLACSRIVASMPCVRLAITEHTAFVLLTMMAILSNTANLMNVLKIQTAQSL